ncbi:MAG TPA: PPK2 family polyphosphate kinase [Blastocatellia bacterium]|nr:PPK2 family polyphosphate kinase [Blastocatellia bacterium]
MTYTFRITGKKKIKLKRFDPDFDAGLTREEAEARTAQLCQEMMELQELLYAASDHSVLIVLQGRDTSGKDGTIRVVMGPLNSLACNVASFKVPTAHELAHDFLWRVHSQTPGRGQMTIFNRSHYEDVLVVRVHNLAPKKVWKPRYEHINNFEQLLVDTNTIVLKFYLHISPEEQEERLLEREKNATKAWKLSVGDWKEREHWDDYTVAYEDAINRCSTKDAPWHIVPANKKWFRNLAVAQAIVDALKPYKKAWLKKLDAMGAKEKALIEEFRRARQT